MDLPMRDRGRREREGLERRGQCSDYAMNDPHVTYSKTRKMDVSSSRIFFSRPLDVPFTDTRCDWLFLTPDYLGFCCPGCYPRESRFLTQNEIASATHLPPRRPCNSFRECFKWIWGMLSHLEGDESERRPRPTDGKT